jgi:hypothetical protein
MVTDGPRRGWNGRQSIGAMWEKTGASGPFLTLELETGAILADGLAALARGEERISYFAFANEKKPDGRAGQPDHRIVRPLRRAETDEGA